jgi:hypothetical protein
MQILESFCCLILLQFYIFINIYMGKIQSNRKETRAVFFGGVDGGLYSTKRWCEVVA